MTGITLSESGSHLLTLCVSVIVHDQGRGISRAIAVKAIAFCDLVTRVAPRLLALVVFVGERVRWVWSAALVPGSLWICLLYATAAEMSRTFHVTETDGAVIDNLIV